MPASGQPIKPFGHEGLQPALAHRPLTLVDRGLVDQVGLEQRARDLGTALD